MKLKILIIAIYSVKLYSQVILKVTPDYLVNDARLGVKYLLNDKEREPFKISFDDDGLLVDNKGRLFDTQFREDIFVVSLEKKLYSGIRSGEKFIFRHSSFMAGRPVLYAGTFIVDKGVIVNLSDRSGHYRPTLRDYSESIKFFKENKVKFIKTRINLGNLWASLYLEEDCLVHTTDKNIIKRVSLSLPLSVKVIEELVGRDNWVND